MKNNRKRKRIVFVVTAFVISAIALAFVVTNFRNNIVFFYSPSELMSEEIAKKSAGQMVRIGGLVKEGTINKIDALTTEFIVTDLNQELKVHYTGLLPDLFREKQGVVAKGKYDASQNIFLSRELLIKHDEKYMPPEVYKALRDNKKTN